MPSNRILYEARIGNGAASGGDGGEAGVGLDTAHLSVSPPGGSPNASFTAPPGSPGATQVLNTTGGTATSSGGAAVGGVGGVDGAPAAAAQQPQGPEVPQYGGLPAILVDGCKAAHLVVANPGE
jgi:hypothetical protein